jgi:hypothetical protein
MVCTKAVRILLNKYWRHDFDDFLSLHKASFPATKVSGDQFFNKMKTTAMLDL